MGDRDKRDIREKIRNPPWYERPYRDGVYIKSKGAFDTADQFHENLTIPDFDLQIPILSMPDVVIPEVDLPDINLPDIDFPTINLNFLNPLKYITIPVTEIMMLSIGSVIGWHYFRKWLREKIIGS